MGNTSVRVCGPLLTVVFGTKTRGGSAQAKTFLPEGWQRYRAPLLRRLCFGFFLLLLTKDDTVLLKVAVV